MFNVSTEIDRKQKLYTHFFMGFAPVVRLNNRNHSFHVTK